MYEYLGILLKSIDFPFFVQWTVLGGGIALTRHFTLPVSPYLADCSRLLTMIGEPLRSRCTSRDTVLCPTLEALQVYVVNWSDVTPVSRSVPSRLSTRSSP